MKILILIYQLCTWRITMTRLTVKIWSNYRISSTYPIVFLTRCVSWQFLGHVVCIFWLVFSKCWTSLTRSLASQPISRSTIDFIQVWLRCLAWALRISAAHCRSLACFRRWLWYLSSWPESNFSHCKFDKNPCNLPLLHLHFHTQLVMNFLRQHLS